MKTILPVLDIEVEVPDNEYLVSETDLKGRITYANTVFAQTSAYTVDALIGASHNIVRHPDMPRQVFAELWSTLKQGLPWQGVVKNRCRDGRFYWVNATIVPINVNEERIGYMSVRKRATADEIGAAEAQYARMRTRPAETPAPASTATPDSLLKGLMAFFLIWMLAGAGVGLYSMQKSHQTTARLYTALQASQQRAASEIQGLKTASQTPANLLQSTQQAEVWRADEDRIFRNSLGLVFVGLLGGGILALFYYRNLQRLLCAPLAKAVRDCERISHGDLVKPIDIDQGAITRKISASLAIMQTHLMVMIDEIHQGIRATRSECRVLQEATQKNVINAETQYLHLQKVRDLLDEIAGSFTDTSNQAEALLESFLQPEPERDATAKSPADLEHEFRELVTATRLSAFIIEDCLQQLNEVNELIVESRETSHAVHHSAESLRNMARMLTDLIGRFKTTEGTPDAR